MELKFPKAIIDCQSLFERLDDDEIRIYDCTTILHYTDDHPQKPYDVESGFGGYQQAHIPGAAFLDLQSDFSNNESPYKFTLPNPTQLFNAFKNNGVGDPHQIVFYSRNGMQWSTRFWWMIHHLGYKKISILNGGINEWENLGLPLERGIRKYPPSDFKVSMDFNIFVNKDSVYKSMQDQSSVLVNALTEDLHQGLNPRYGRPGRIPNSINVPFKSLLEDETYKLKSPKELMKAFEVNGVNQEQKIVNYCGGGISATLNAFVLRQLGFKELNIYDKSMSEWAMDENLPIEKD